MARAQRQVGRSSPASPAAARFLLRLPPDLHRALTTQAAHEQTSLNELCVMRLSGPDLPFLPRRDVAAVMAQARAVTGAHLRGVIVHGSWARGEARSTSDVDLLVVVGHALPLARTLYRAWDNDAPTWDGRPVDAHFLHLPGPGSRPGSVWCEAATEGMLLADATGEVSAALIQVRTAIAQGRLVRKSAHGQPYWTVAA